MEFMEALKKEANEYDTVLTENGAEGYRTTTNPIVDINYLVSSLRDKNEHEIIEMFKDAFIYDEVLSVVWIFYVRDVRGGLGERRLFRILIKYLASIEPELVNNLLEQISFYGRWDDVIDLLGISSFLDSRISCLIKEQIKNDLSGISLGKSISLLGKWLPSANAGKASRKNALALIKLLKLREPQYRHICASLRKYLKVVEVKMSAKKWGEIDYSEVPSKANLLYNKAFFRHDEERRAEYISKVEKGEEKINSSVTFPHEIVHKYTESSYWNRIEDTDTTLEVLWKALPQMETGGDTLVIADTSGSMETCIGGTRVSCADVCRALTIYFSEHAKGAYKDKAILFSSRPKYIEFKPSMSLREKLNVMIKYNECSNTNIEKAFKLVLDTAVKSKATQEELPSNILVLSDMEFDYACDDSIPMRAIAKRFEDAGYKMPKLIFWNINSRSGAIPVTENEQGVALVGGFSVNIIKMILSGKLSAWECLKEQLTSERYAPIFEIALKN